MLIPDQITAGDSAVWVQKPAQIAGRVASYAQGWELLLCLRGPAALDLAGAARLDGAWSVVLSTTNSATLTPGRYAWSAAVTRADERVTIAIGQTTVVASLTAGTAPIDPRSLAERALDDCRLALASFRASGGRVTSYTIAGRSMTYSTADELLRLEAYWRARVMSEHASAAAAAGMSNPRNLHVRFVGRR